MNSQKPFNKFLFIFVFAASVFFLPMLWSGSSRYSRRYRSTKKVSSEYCFYNLRSNLKSIGQLIYINLTDSDSITSAPQELTDFADDWQLISPAEVFGRE
ncbi:MAG: hypothetical protein HRT88_10690 [Lentisphaeraceae bacterium]|nr:hypothetical protein [Lentisphaeraceae bacterium]